MYVYIARMYACMYVCVGAAQVWYAAEQRQEEAVMLLTQVATPGVNRVRKCYDLS